MSKKETPPNDLMDSSLNVGHNGCIPCEGEVCIHCSINKNNSWWEKQLLGKILTIIDASIHEERANKAIKDLIRQVYNVEMWEAREDLQSLVRKRIEGKLKKSLNSISLPNE